MNMKHVLVKIFILFLNTAQQCCGLLWGAFVQNTCILLVSNGIMEDYVRVTLVCGFNIILQSESPADCGLFSIKTRIRSKFISLLVKWMVMKDYER